MNNSTANKKEPNSEVTPNSWTQIIGGHFIQGSFLLLDSGESLQT